MRLKRSKLGKIRSLTLRKARKDKYALTVIGGVR